MQPNYGNYNFYVVGTNGRFQPTGRRACRNTEAALEAGVKIFYAWCERNAILDDYPPSEAQVVELLHRLASVLCREAPDLKGVGLARSTRQRAATPNR